MPYTQTRTQPWNEVMGADGEKIFAFGGRIGESLSGTGTAGGTVTVSGAVVPAGEVWILTAGAIQDAQTSTTRENLGILSGGNDFIIAAKNAPAIAEWIFATGQFVMIPGDNVQAIFVGTALADTLTVRYFGFKMVIP